MKNKYLQILNQYKSIFLFFLIMILASVLDDTFMSPANITNILQQVASTGIVTVGLTLVNITGGFDMSVGSTMALTGVITMMLLKSGSNLIIAMICGIIIGLLAGLVNGLLIGKVKINPFIATLSTSILIRGIALGITDARPISVWNETFGSLASGTLGIIPISFLTFIGSAILFEWFIKKTKVGHNIYIYGSNKEAGYAAGVKMERTVIMAYMICGVLASIGGFFLSSKLGTGSPIVAGDVALLGTAAIIVGGNKLAGSRANMLRSIVGVIILGMLNNMLNLLGTMSYFQTIIRGLLVVIVVGLDAEGVEEIIARIKSKIFVKI